MSGINGSGQIVISTDGHAGADVQGYRPYLEKKYLDEFDVWAATYVDPWGELTGPSTDQQGHGFEQAVGHAATDIPINWESERRHKLVDGLGLTAEVLFPNTAPPFVPSGAISVPPPQTPREYEYRFAGIKAHNRWMADFCHDAPGQRAGFAQIYLNDLPAAIAEVRWAKEAGLRGVLLPADHMQGLVNLFPPALDPLWAACAELEMPVHRHQILPSMNPQEGGPASFWVGIMEVPFFASRAVSHLLASAIFERFPNLTFVLTELTDATNVMPILARLDGIYQMGLDPRPLNEGGSSIGPYVAEAVSALKRPPSDYFRTNCFVAGPLDPVSAMAAGVPNVMFGADIPHSEGTGKYTHEAVRVTAAGLDDDKVDDFLYRRAAEVYGFDTEFLQSVADKDGITRQEARTPLPRDEYPKYPNESTCGLFAPTRARGDMMGG